MKTKLTVLFLVSILSWCSSQTTVTFLLEGIFLEENQQVGIRGSASPLDWSKSIPLKVKDGKYSLELTFEFLKEDLEFKFVKFVDDQKPVWEVTPNRTFTVSNKIEAQISKNIWEKEQLVDINSLEKISSEDLLKDFELIKTMVLDVHPGTYRYKTKAEISAALDELQDKFSQSLTYQEAYLAMSKLMATIQCDHTKVGFNNQNKLINSIIHYQPDKVPFTFRWVADEMIVVNNVSTSSLLQRGTKILYINDVPVEEIRSQITNYIGADGATDHNRIYKTQVNGYNFRYNAFDVFYPLLFPVKNERIRLLIQQPGETRKDTVFVAMMTRDQRSEMLINKYKAFPNSRDDMWDLEFRSDGVAILKINSFGLNGWKAMTIDYKAFLANAFHQINDQEIKCLVIDIRENTGGADEMANELFGYLTTESFNFDREGRTRYLSFPEKLKPYIQTWGDDPWYYNLQPKQKKAVNGYYIFKKNFKSKSAPSNSKIFKGKLFLLTSAANTSLAFYTAYRFKLQALGTSIGQETGGNLNDINGGQILFLRLPHSKIEIDFPVMGGFTSLPQPNRGVSPDIITEYTVQDLIQKRDLELEEVLKRIQ